MTVAAAHLSFVPGYNIRQLRLIKLWLRQFPRPVVLMGDFNLPGRLPGWVTGWPELIRAASYPSFGPKVQFDHILGDGLTVEQVAAARAGAEDPGVAGQRPLRLCGQRWASTGAGAHYCVMSR
jgi:endonuclease/exonuclease/phosphatase family metal-dependent hydrolase